MDGTNPTSNNDGSWQFKPSDNPDPYSIVAAPAASPAPPTTTDEAITWTASEFIAHSKSSGWYGALALGAVIGAVFVWLITKDVVSTGFIIFAAAILGAYAGRQPRELPYRIDAHGVTIGNRYFEYHSFRSFSVTREGAFPCIVFTPMKRFGQLTTIYYDPRNEAIISEMLSRYLPHEPRRSDPIDRLMWRIRF